MTIQRIVSVSKPIDTRSLDRELRAALIPLDGISYDSGLQEVRVRFLDNATTQQQGADTDAVIASHAGVDRPALNVSDVRTRWAASPLKGKTPAQIFTTMQGQIDGWTTLAQAKADLRVWLPLIIATLAWEIEKDAQE